MIISDIFRIKKLKTTVLQQQAQLHQYELDIHSLSTDIEDINNKRIELDKTIRLQNSLLTDDNGNAVDIHNKILELQNYFEKLEEDRNERKAEFDADINQKKEEIQELEDQIKNLRADIIELDEVKLLQDFGLYKPTYSFTSSSKYKEALDNIRTKQTRMIVNKTAATCNTQWTVNGNRQTGQKMANDHIKQALMTFNVECENAIGNVKFNNFDSMKSRIERLYKKINDLSETTAVTISFEYYLLKLDELAIAYEYSVKKQEEKEYIREQREIQREDAKVQRELEEERKKIEKEENHFKNLLIRLQEQLAAEANYTRKEMIQEKIDATKVELSDLSKALSDVDYRQANERAGYVYIISNIGAFGEDIYKIGMTRRLEPLDRINELGGASVPFHFDVHAMVFSSDAPKLETALHNAFADSRVNMMNNRKEFFKVRLEEIETVVRQNHDRTVDFVYAPSAEQYRETMKIKHINDASN